jgi:hypothetical protein
MSATEAGVTAMWNWKVLVVIGCCILLCAAIAVPFCNKVRAAAARMQCTGNLKHIALAVHNYHDSSGAFPQGSWHEASLPRDERFSWLVAVLPYVESNNLYSSFLRSEPSTHEHNARLAKTRYPIFLCPGNSNDPRDPDGATHYVGVAGLGAEAADLPLNSPLAGVFGYERKVRMKDVKDGLAMTLLAVETGRNTGQWTYPGPGTMRGLDTADQPYIGSERQLGRPHLPDRFWNIAGGAPVATVALCDGSVRPITSDLRPAILEALCTIAGDDLDSPCGSE